VWQGHGSAFTLLVLEGPPFVQSETVAGRQDSYSHRQGQPEAHSFRFHHVLSFWYLEF
jgi:hypothetical protein